MVWLVVGFDMLTKSSNIFLTGKYGKRTPNSTSTGLFPRAPESNPFKYTLFAVINVRYHIIIVRVVPGDYTYDYYVIAYVYYGKKSIFKRITFRCSWK